MVVSTSTAIEQTLVAIVADLIQDWGLELDNGITGCTRLVADLEFSSIDIIQLCVATEQHYQQKMGFQNLLMKDGSYVSDLSIAQMAEFIGDKVQGRSE